MSSNQSGQSAQFEITNFGPNASVEQFVEFLGFGASETSRNSCSVALSACKTFAIVMVPEESKFQVNERNGEPFDGGKVVIKQIASNAPSVEQDQQQPQNSQDPTTAAPQLTDLASIAAMASPL